MAKPKRAKIWFVRLLKAGIFLGLGGLIALVAGVIIAMQSLPSFESLKSSPNGQMIRVHAESLAKAARVRQCRSIAPGNRVADAGQARIIINALRREIDRLLRGIDRFDRKSPCPHIPFAQPADSSAHEEPSDSAIAFAKLASPTSRHKVYSAARLGVPLAPSLAAGITSPSITGGSASQAGSAPLGALLDVLI